MSKKNGFRDTHPVIKSVEFPKDRIRIILADGRILILPVKSFPEIGKLKPAQKRRHKILAGTGLMFDDIDDVFHISDFIGNIHANYPLSDYSDRSAFSNVAESRSRYGSSSYKFSDEEMKETYRRSKELKSGKVKGISMKETVKRAKAVLKKAKKH